MERSTFRPRPEASDRFIEDAERQSRQPRRRPSTRQQSTLASARTDVQKLFTLCACRRSTFDAAIHCGTHAGHHAEILLEAFIASDRGEGVRIDAGVNR